MNKIEKFLVVFICLCMIGVAVSSMFIREDFRETEKAFDTCVGRLKISLIDNIMCYSIPNVSQSNFSVTFPEAFDYIENSNISEQILEAVAT